MTTIVVGTAGHIDHGKTALLRALSGIDADRLPEERRRGMTIDVGYAHLTLSDGTELDFVDVPGHDRLVGNMLVGAGEIDAALVVVAADDGPRAQTFEHLALLDALGIGTALAVVTKIDLVPASRVDSVRAEVGELLRATTMAGAAVVAASSETGEGVDELRTLLAALRDRALAESGARPRGPLRLAIDRVFASPGRGAVVTGTLRGGVVEVGSRLRLEPGGSPVRVRGLQVHGTARPSSGGGRTALNLADVDAAEIARGQVLTAGPGVETTSRLLAVLRPAVSLGAPTSTRRVERDAWPPQDGARLRLHLATDQVDAVVGAIRGSPMAPGPVALVRLARPVATFVGDRGVLRDPARDGAVAGLVVLDPQPPRGVSRRRLTPERLATLAAAVADADAAGAADALVAIHGALAPARVDAAVAALAGGDAGSLDVGVGGRRAPRAGVGGREAPPARASARDARSSDRASQVLTLAPDVVASLEDAALAAVAGHHDANPMSPSLPLAELRPRLIVELRRRATLARSTSPAASIDPILDDLVARRRLAREADGLRDAHRSAGPPAALAAAMGRLEAALDLPAPPPLSEAAAAAGCPAEGIRLLEAAGRIVRPEADLAWSAAAYRRLAARALAMAERGELTPAAFRDATGTSRKYVLAILEDLGRRGILARTPAGHVPGPRAPRAGPVAPRTSEPPR